MNKLLVALDGSEFAEAAVPVAKDLAACGAKIALVTVGNLPETVLQSEQEERDLHGMLRRVATHFGIEADIKVKMIGDPVNGILEAAEEEGADIIVMATHGRSGLSELAHGSTANDVVHSGHTPVLLVHPGRTPERSGNHGQEELE